MTSRRRDDEGDGKGFLSRWSQRKQAAESGTPPQEAPAEETGRTAPDAAAAGQAAPVDPAALPDIDSLDKDSDFSVFLQQGVPRALQRRALRRLWQVDPLFQEICMLDDYNLDYTDAATVVPNLKTAYQVGRGMILDETEEADADGGPEGQEGDAGEVPQEQQAAAPEKAPEPATGAPAAATAPADTKEPRRKDLKPGTPRVAPPATPRTAAASPAAGPAGRSARQRRWGDPDQQ